MFYKKLLIVFLFLIVGMLAVSSVSADEDVNDTLTTDDNVVEDISANIEDTMLNEVEDSESLSASDENSELSLDNSSDVLESPSHDAYNVWFYSDDIEIHTWQSETVRIYINPNTGSGYAYDFYFNVYDSDGDRIIQKNFYSYSENTYVDYTFSTNQLSAGSYTMELVNYEDSYIFDTVNLTVTSDPFYAVITAGNYNAYYNAGTTYSIRVTEKGTGDALTGVSLKFVFKKGSSTVTKYYTTGSNGYVKFTPPVGVGTWTVTISSNNAHVTATAVIKTVTLKKSSVSMKAYKAKTYKGFKLTLKAKVKSQGKNVNEGTVTFHINGKNYKASVKNGVATKSIKLKKIKKYKYTAKFTGSNFKSKKVKSKASVKKRYATKLTTKKKKITGYWTKSKKVQFKVTTKKGKKVNGGYLFIYDKTHGWGYKANVKHGKAKFQFNYIASYYSGYGYYAFSKKVVTKYKITYVPATLKYKCSHIKFKKVSKYKCPTCGKKKTHTHGSGAYKTYYYVN